MADQIAARLFELLWRPLCREYQSPGCQRQREFLLLASGPAVLEAGCEGNTAQADISECPLMAKSGLFHRSIFPLANFLAWLSKAMLLPLGYVTPEISLMTLYGPLMLCVSIYW